MDQSKRRKRKKKKVKITKASDCWVTRENFKIDYKDLDTLERFMTPHGKIMNRRRIGISVQAMNDAKKAIKRAQHLALIPYKVF